MIAIYLVTYTVCLVASNLPVTLVFIIWVLKGIPPGYATAGKVNIMLYIVALDFDRLDDGVLPDGKSMASIANVKSYFSSLKLEIESKWPQVLFEAHALNATAEIKSHEHDKIATEMMAEYQIIVARGDTEIPAIK